MQASLSDTCVANKRVKSTLAQSVTGASRALGSPQEERSRKHYDMALRGKRLKDRSKLICIPRGFKTSAGEYLIAGGIETAVRVIDPESWPAPDRPVRQWPSVHEASSDVSFFTKDEEVEFDVALCPGHQMFSVAVPNMEQRARIFAALYNGVTNITQLKRAREQQSAGNPATMTRSRFLPRAEKIETKHIGKTPVVEVPGGARMPLVLLDSYLIAHEACGLRIFRGTSSTDRWPRGIHFSLMDVKIPKEQQALVHKLPCGSFDLAAEDYDGTTAQKTKLTTPIPSQVEKASTANPIPIPEAQKASRRQRKTQGTSLSQGIQSPLSRHDSNAGPSTLVPPTAPIKGSLSPAESVLNSRLKNLEASNSRLNERVEDLEKQLRREKTLCEALEAAEHKSSRHEAVLKVMADFKQHRATVDEQLQRARSQNADLVKEIEKSKALHSADLALIDRQANDLRALDILKAENGFLKADARSQEAKITLLEAQLRGQTK